jgi:hypothetical protein
MPVMTLYEEVESAVATQSPRRWWQLALRFRDYDHLFSQVTYAVQQRKKAPS